MNAAPPKRGVIPFSANGRATTSSWRNGLRDRLKSGFINLNSGSTPDEGIYEKDQKNLL